jgi:hypothetical protein
MKLSTRYPSLDLASDASNLRNVISTIWDAFRRVALAFNTPDAGVSASRPTQELTVGQPYFDTTLGLPIWWNGTDWIDSAGTVV